MANRRHSQNQELRGAIGFSELTLITDGRKDGTATEGQCNRKGLKKVHTFRKKDS